MILILLNIWFDIYGPICMKLNPLYTPCGHKHGPVCATRRRPAFNLVCFLSTHWGMKHLKELITHQLVLLQPYMKSSGADPKNCSCGKTKIKKLILRAMCKIYKKILKIYYEIWIFFSRKITHYSLLRFLPNALS